MKKIFNAIKKVYENLDFIMGLVDQAKQVKELTGRVSRLEQRVASLEGHDAHLKNDLT